MMKRLYYPLLLIFVLLCGALTGRAQTTSYVCYDGSKTFMVENTVNQCMWLTKQTSATIWDTVVSLDNVYSYTLNNVIVSMDIQCVYDTNDDGITDSMALNETVVPYSQLVSGVISTDPVVCYDSTAAITFSTLPSGGGDSYYYFWESSTDSVNFTSLADADTMSSNYNTAALTDTMYYRVNVVSVAGCGSEYTDVITINVANEFMPAVISCATVSTICKGDAPMPITVSSAEYGGLGVRRGHFEQRIGNGEWTVVTADSVLTYQPSALTDTTQYRYYSSSDCGVVYSNIITINVYPELVAGVITGGTYVCANSTAQLSLMTDCTGGEDPYSYQWQMSADGITYSDLPGATQTTYQTVVTNPNSNSNNVIWYRLAFSSASGCDTVYSSPHQITVRPEVQGATINSSTTSPICYGTAPAPITIVTPASGGDSVFTNQWQVFQTATSTWVDIAGEIASSYQPGIITEATQYRVVSTSVCGIDSSNVVTVEVFDPISSGTLPTQQQACYMSDVHIQPSVLPSGGGGSYTYQWLGSLNNVSYSEITGANDISFAAPNITTKHYYKLVVTSTLGCGSDTTNPIEINVFDEFLPGTIAGIDTICHNTSTNALYMSTNCTGGATPYQYQWQKSVNGVDYVDIDGATSTVCSSGNLTVTSLIRLKFISNNGCGFAYSSPIEVYVYPEITAHSINGEGSVCYAQYETYTLPEASDDYSYTWSTENGNGTITILSPNNDSVEIYWESPQTLDTIAVTVTDNETGCTSINYKPVQTLAETAPDRTVIVRKPNSNILVCEQESPSMYYQWGYTIKATGEDVVIENSNRRYVLLPHDFDSIKYDYWVVLAPNATSPCYSTSYYDPANDSLIVVPEATKLTVYNIARLKLNITVSNVGDKATQIGVYNMMGCAVYETTLPSSSHGVTVELPERGVFVVRATPQGTEPMAEKVVVE